MSEEVVRFSEVEKTYRIGFWRKKVHAVRGISLSVRRGEIFGLVGPNGAGKTTTMKMLTGLVTPDRGKIELLGHNVTHPRVRARIGYLPENPYFYEHLNAMELLFYYGSLHGLSRRTLRSRSQRLLEQVGLSGVRKRPIRKYSKGMRQRIGIAQALINDPEFVILDEPQTGLDPLGRKDVRDLIFSLKESGKTVLFSSHVLPDVEAVCDRVAVMQEGRICECGRLDELTSDGLESIEITVRHLDEHQASRLDYVTSVTRRADVLVLKAALEADLGKLVSQLNDAGARLVSVTPHKQNLEDVFVRDHIARDKDAL